MYQNVWWTAVVKESTMVFFINTTSTFPWVSLLVPRVFWTRWTHCANDLPALSWIYKGPGHSPLKPVTYNNSLSLFSYSIIIIIVFLQPRAWRPTWRVWYPQSMLAVYFQLICVYSRKCKPICGEYKSSPFLYLNQMNTMRFPWGKVIFCSVCVVFHFRFLVALLRLWTVLLVPDQFIVELDVDHYQSPFQAGSTTKALATYLRYLLQKTRPENIPRRMTPGRKYVHRHHRVDAGSQR